MAGESREPMHAACDLMLGRLRRAIAVPLPVSGARITRADIVLSPPIAGPDGKAARKLTVTVEIEEVL